MDLGIEAFTAGTSFGAVINSALASLGGVAGSSGESGAEEGDGEEKESDEISEAVAESVSARSAGGEEE